MPDVRVLNLQDQLNIKTLEVQFSNFRLTWWASSSSQKRLFFNDSGKMHFTCIIENFLNEGRSTLIVQLFCNFSILYLHRKGMRAGKLTLISLQKINSSIYPFFDKTHGTHTSESTIIMSHQMVFCSFFGQGARSDSQNLTAFSTRIVLQVCQITCIFIAQGGNQIL